MKNFHITFQIVFYILLVQLLRKWVNKYENSNFICFSSKEKQGELIPTNFINFQNVNVGKSKHFNLFNVDEALKYEHSLSIKLVSRHFCLALLTNIQRVAQLYVRRSSVCVCVYLSKCCKIILVFIIIKNLLSFYFGKTTRLLELKIDFHQTNSHRLLRNCESPLK